MGLCCGVELQYIPDAQITIFDDPDTPSASQYAGGMLAPYSESDTLTPELQALAFKYSLPFWQNLSKRFDVHYQALGTLVLAHPEDKPLLKRFATHLPEGSFETVTNLTSYEPQLSKRIADGLHVYDEAYLDTRQILNAMKTPLTIVKEAKEPEDITGFDIVIDARGHRADIKGMRKIKGERALIHCPDLKLKHCIRLMHPRYPLYVVPHANDIYMVGASMIEDNDEKTVSMRSALELLTAFTSLSPMALEADIISLDAGFRPAFEDHIPRIEQQGHIYACNGLYRHGFLLAPVLAKAVAAQIMGEDFQEGASQFFIGETHEAIH